MGVIPEMADVVTSSDDYARRFSGPVGEWFLKVQRNATLKMLTPHPGATILDVGGGHGQLARALIETGHSVTVFGSSEACGAQIQDLIDENLCSFDVGNLLELPYSDGAFDLVLSFRLLCHVERWPRLLAELARVAKMAVIVDYPAIQSLNVFAPKLFFFKKRVELNTRPFILFKDSQLVAVFESCGLEVAACYRQFFLPMLLHRLLGAPVLSAAIESACRMLGGTHFFGSPVILKAVRKVG